MRKNTLAAGIGGFVVALCVVGLGYLFLGQRGRSPRSPLEDDHATAPGRDASQPTRRSPTGPIPRRRTIKAPRVAQKPVPPAPTDPRAIEKRIAELLARYDEIMSAGTRPGTGLSLSERRRRIDQLVRELAARGEKGVPFLLAALRQDALANNTPREMLVVRALARIPGAEATRALKEVLASSQWGVQMAVVAQLAGRGPEGIQALKDRLLVEGDFRVRGAILKQIGRSGDPGAMELIARLARDDPDPNVRRAAVRQLAMSKDPATVRTLEDLARAAQDISVRQAAIQAYAQAAGPNAVVILQDILQSDPNLRVRSVAILGLQVVGTEEALLALQQVADDQTQTADVRARARGAVAAVNRQRSGGSSVGANIRGQLKPITGPGLRPLRPIGSGN